MNRTLSVFCAAALLAGGFALVTPTDAAAASARSTATTQRPSTAKRVHAPGKKAYTTQVTSRKAAANQSKKQSRQQDGQSARNKRNAGSFQPVAVTWTDARRHERQAAGAPGATVQKRSTGGRSVTFRDQRGTVASEKLPRLQRGPDGTARPPAG